MVGAGDTTFGAGLWWASSSIWWLSLCRPHQHHFWCRHSGSPFTCHVWPIWRACNSVRSMRITFGWMCLPVTGHAITSRARWCDVDVTCVSLPPIIDVVNVIEADHNSNKFHTCLISVWKITWNWVCRVYFGRLVAWGAQCSRREWGKRLVYQSRNSALHVTDASRFVSTSQWVDFAWVCAMCKMKQPQLMGSPRYPTTLLNDILHTEWYFQQVKRVILTQCRWEENKIY